MRESRLMGGVRRALVVVGAVFGVALLSAGVASAADPVQLKSRLGNWCLDGPNGNNTATMVNPCNGSKSQLWVFNSAGQIESVAFPGDCVSISDAADNTPVILSPCQTNANNVRWNPQTNGQIIECPRSLPQRFRRRGAAWDSGDRLPLHRRCCRRGVG